MPTSFSSARRGRTRIRGHGLILDKDLLCLGYSLRTLGGSKPKGYEAQHYPGDRCVVSESHRVVRKWGELVVERGEEDQDGQHREHAVQYHVELVSALTKIEDDAGQADDHVHQYHYDGHRRCDDAEATDRLEGCAENEGDDEGEYRLRYDRHVRRAMLWVGTPEHARQHVDTAHSVDHTGCSVDPCVGVGYGAVGYGEEDDNPPNAPIILRHGGPGVGVLGVGAHLAEPPAHHGGVSTHEVEQPDHERRGDDHPGYGSPRVAGFLPKRSRGLEADEGEDGEDHPLEHARP